MATFHLVLATLLLTTTLAISPPPQPADHLVPPPAPPGAHSAHSLPIAQRLTHAGYSVPAPAAAGTSPETSGFMTRVARWFGLGGGGAAASLPRDQQLSPSSLNYAYPKPAQHFDAAGKPCGLCNKYPWVPMLGQQQQQQQQQQQPQQQILAWQQPVGQASQHRQRAVQFHAPPQQPAAAGAGAGAQSVFLPISVPVPGLSHVAMMPPLYSAQPFRPLENIVGAHSELRPVPILSTTQTAGPFKPSPSGSGGSSSSFEIVQSHQLTDFVTSVEYPATYVQSHAIDLGQTTPQNQQYQHHHEQQSEPVPPPLEEISTVRYQLEDLSSGAVHQHLPASQLLTELGHLEAQTTSLPPADNYPAASSQQHQHHHQEDEPEQHLFYAEQYQELNSETSTEHTIYTTEQATPAAAVELNNHLMQPIHTRDPRQRDTPKRMLDSPINHVQSGARPFTRDPADLHIRPPMQPTQAPTPTSTYGAIDASGQYAGMSPPGPQQVIIPYTTKQKPRPFEPAKWTPNWLSPRPSHLHRHHQQQDNDVEHQESKLVSTATAAPPPNTRRTTKYLTKILASNLRELLKRERETKRRPMMPAHFGVDIFKLQHNIDGWTEQEYNSLSHRPSTPTIRGRSKHIPSEYLTTTTPATPTASTKTTTTRGGFELGGGSSMAVSAGRDLSTSINNLEQLHLKRFQPVDDNRLLDYYDSQLHNHRTTTTSMPTTTTTTTMMPTTTMAPVTPLYVRSTIAQTPAPIEVWKQAKVAILPQTNEKVYVVTPQPRYQHHHHGELEGSASVPSPVYQTPSARFPRMRPTIGTATATSELTAAATPTPATEQLRNYTPDIFGLMGLSAYVPAEPVEIIDGNSKVNTIVTTTPTATAAALQRQTTRSTIPPRPR